MTLDIFTVYAQTIPITSQNPLHGATSPHTPFILDDDGLAGFPYNTGITITIDNNPMPFSFSVANEASSADGTFNSLATLANAIELQIGNSLIVKIHNGALHIASTTLKLIAFDNFDPTYNFVVELGLEQVYLSDTL